MAVYRVEDGLTVESNAASSLIKLENVAMARWYFVTEYFESRGWWRTSKTACWVREMPGAFNVRAVLVFDPETGESQIFGEESPLLSDDGVTSMGIAARAWFDAHPVPRYETKGMIRMDEKNLDGRLPEGEERERLQKIAQAWAAKQEERDAARRETGSLSVSALIFAGLFTTSIKWPMVGTVGLGVIAGVSIIGAVTRIITHRNK